MKKQLLFSLLTLLSAFFASAQCTPDPQYTEPGVYPDSATGFAGACVDVPYELTITNIVPVDTVTIFGGIPLTVLFDSVVISSFTGLPPGYIYQCLDLGNVTSPTDQCAFEGGTTGCVLISGTSTLADVGTYPLSITVDAYVGGLGAPTTQVVDYYSIVVTDCVAGIEEGENTASFSVYPNPANESIRIAGISEETYADLRVLNASGQEMHVATYQNNSEFHVKIAELENGIYFVEIIQDERREIIRFIKE